MNTMELTDLVQTICTKIAFWVTPENSGFAQWVGPIIVVSGLAMALGTAILYMVKK